MKTSDSLGGQNTVNRDGGGRSSRPRSTSFKQLRKLDRQIGVLDYRIRIFGKEWTVKDQKKRAVLDAKRAGVRFKVKNPDKVVLENRDGKQEVLRLL